jgi:hypothetical protein
MGERIVALDAERLWVLDGELAVLGSVAVAGGELTLYHPTLLFPVDADRILVSDGEHPPVLVDLSDPARPRRLGQVAVDGDLVALAPGGLLVTLAVEQGSGRFEVRTYDAAEPLRPRALGRLSIRGGPVSAALLPGYLLLSYVTFTGEYGDGILQAVDLADPGAPRLMPGGLPHHLLQSLTVDGRRGFAVDDSLSQPSVVTLDLSDPTAPRLLGEQPAGAGTIHLLADGATVYATARSYGVDVLDVTSPAEPFRRAELPSAGETQDLCFFGDRLLVADGEGGLWSYDRAALRGLSTIYGDVSDPPGAGP